LSAHLKTRIDKLEKVKRTGEPEMIEAWLIGEDGYCEQHLPSRQLIERITQTELDGRNAKRSVKVIRVDIGQEAI